MTKYPRLSREFRKKVKNLNRKSFDDAIDSHSAAHYLINYYAQASVHAHLFGQLKEHDGDKRLLENFLEKYDFIFPNKAGKGIFCKSSKIKKEILFPSSPYYYIAQSEKIQLFNGDIRNCLYWYPKIEGREAPEDYWRKMNEVEYLMDKKWQKKDLMDNELINHGLNFAKFFGERSNAKFKRYVGNTRPLEMIPILDKLRDYYKAIVEINIKENKRLTRR